MCKTKMFSNVRLGFQLIQDIPHRQSLKKTRRYYTKLWQVQKGNSKWAGDEGLSAGVQVEIDGGVSGWRMGRGLREDVSKAICQSVRDWPNVSNVSQLSLTLPPDYLQCFSLELIGPLAIDLVQLKEIRIMIRL